MRWLRRWVGGRDVGQAGGIDRSKRLVWGMASVFSGAAIVKRVGRYPTIRRHPLVASRRHSNVGSSREPAIGFRDSPDVAHTNRRAGDLTNGDHPSVQHRTSRTRNPSLYARPGRQDYCLGTKSESSPKSSIEPDGTTAFPPIAGTAKTRARATRCASTGRKPAGSRGLSNWLSQIPIFSP